jgi:hypothetical protein
VSGQSSGALPAASTCAFPVRTPLPKAMGREPLAGRSNTHRVQRRGMEDRNSALRPRSHRGVWPGIALEFYGNPRNLEFDFVVAPGADPGAFACLTTVSTGSQPGPTATSSSRLEATRPSAAARVFQEIHGSRKEVEALTSARQLTKSPLRVGPYDKRAELRIDPVLVYSSYLGGDTAVTGGSDYARAVAVDASGTSRGGRNSIQRLSDYGPVP